LSNWGIETENELDVEVSGFGKEEDTVDMVEGDSVVC